MTAGGTSGTEASTDSGSHAAPQFDEARVPLALRERSQWVCWQYVTRDGKPTKVPIDARTGRRAKTNDSTTWGSFDDALMAWRRNARYAGIGFVFTAEDQFTGIDLDGCIDDDGKPVPEARRIVEEFDSYTEISPSGYGVKLIIVGKKPEGARCRTKKVDGFEEIEIYSTGRYFTITGCSVDGTPRSIEERQTQLDAFCEHLWPQGQREKRSDDSHASRSGFEGDDNELIQKACQAKNGDTFRRLWRGDTTMHGGDDSAADLALCALLAFWTCRDATQMDRLFRLSGLFRAKWDERRGEHTYGQMTIDRAIADCAEVYAPRNRRNPQSREAPTANGTDGQIEEDQQLVPLGQRDPKSGRLVLSPRRTLPTAEAYIREFSQHASGRTLLFYAGLLLEWRDNRYRWIEDQAIKHRLQSWLHSALRYQLKRRTGEMELVDFESNPATVKAALESIQTFTHLPATTVAPSWLGDHCDSPSAVEILPCKTLSLHIPTCRVLPATPALFTINALDFDYDREPDAPELWVKFLEQLWGDDLESVQLLQEWFGYCLTADTSQQKMMLLVGPRRSGKGTIGRILTRLVGPANVVGPTTSSLAGTFGLQALINKSVAIVSDARFRGANVSTVIERLLCISGEDTLTIDRKYLGAVSMKLPTRFMFLTNELPRLADVSTALAGRFLVLRLTRSFFGREDPTLTDRLVAELPGILLWAIDGWKRLRQRGWFMQPESAEDAVRDMEDLGSPVGAFVRERCTVGPGHRAWLDDLYRGWKAWCEQDGRTAVSNKQTFGRDLTAAVPGVKRRRGTGMVAFYEGIALREAYG